MSDYLKGLCSQNKIKLVYTDNDYTILSSGVSNNTPILKVYNKFSDCTENIADAILGYYTTNNKKFLRVLENYVEDDLFLLGYEIEPPDRMFLDLVNSKVNVKIYQSYVKKDKSPDYVEMAILSITKKDFYGNTSRMRPKQALKTPSDSVAELDIIIDDD